MAPTSTGIVICTRFLCPIPQSQSHRRPTLSTVSPPPPHGLCGLLPDSVCHLYILLRQLWSSLHTTETTLVTPHWLCRLLPDSVCHLYILLRQLWSHLMGCVGCCLTLSTISTYYWDNSGHTSWVVWAVAWFCLPSLHTTETTLVTLHWLCRLLPDPVYHLYILLRQLWSHLMGCVGCCLILSAISTYYWDNSGHTSWVVQAVAWSCLPSLHTTETTLVTPHWLCRLLPDSVCHLYILLRQLWSHLMGCVGCCLTLSAISTYYWDNSGHTSWVVWAVAWFCLPSLHTTETTLVTLHWLCRLLPDPVYHLYILLRQLWSHLMGCVGCCLILSAISTYYWDNSGHTSWVVQAVAWSCLPSLHTTETTLEKC